MQTGHHLSSCARGHMVGGGEGEREKEEVMKWQTRGGGEARGK